MRQTCWTLPGSGSARYCLRRERLWRSTEIRHIRISMSGSRHGKRMGTRSTYRPVNTGNWMRYGIESTARRSAPVSRNICKRSGRPSEQRHCDGRGEQSHRPSARTAL